MAAYDKRQAYRDRQRRSGKREILVALPAETLELLQRVQTVRGYANRSETLDALVQTELEAFKREESA